MSKFELISDRERRQDENKNIDLIEDQSFTFAVFIQKSTNWNIIIWNFPNFVELEKNGCEQTHFWESLRWYLLRKS